MRSNRYERIISLEGKVHMYELVVSFEKTDTEMMSILNHQFGENIIYEENKGFNGLEVLLTAVVPIAALSVQVLDFIISNFKDRPSNAGKRVIISSDGSIDLRGYSEEEACKIIRCYFDNQDDK